MKTEVICTTNKLKDSILLDLLETSDVLKVEAKDTITNKIIAIAVPSNDYVKYLN